MNYMDKCVLTGKIKIKPCDVSDNIEKVRELKESCMEISILLRNSTKNDDQKAELQAKRRQLISELKSTLVHCQAISDEQLKHLSSTKDFVEVKNRRLDQESRNLGEKSSIKKLVLICFETSTLDPILTENLLSKVDDDNCRDNLHCPSSRRNDNFGQKSEKKSTGPNQTPTSEDSETSNNIVAMSTLASTTNLKSAGKLGSIIFS